MSDNKRIMIIYVLLFAIALLNVTFDYSISKYAITNGGFYESNGFSSLVGLFNHFIILASGICCFQLYTFYTDKLQLATLFYMLFNIIWTTNNIISVVLLYA